MLQVIHDDEITHVAVGHRQFTRLCAELGVDPVERFRSEVRTHFYGSLKGPYNAEDREKTGMGAEWYENLEGRAFHGSKAEKGGLVEGLSKDVAALKV